MLWLQSGQIDINNDPIATETGVYCTPSAIIKNTGLGPATVLRFIVSAQAVEIPSTLKKSSQYSKLIVSQAVNVSDTTMLLRLDQVDFPPAAIAYRHTHPGPGVRYLVSGELQLLSDHGTQLISVGEAWFEDANTAVTATAGDVKPSCFVRTMLLPLAYEGRSTFTLCNESDAGKPTLQSNTRHAEKRINVDEIH